MTLTDEDIGKIATLLKPIEERIDGLETKMDQRFDEIQSSIDQLFKRDEAREHEYLALRNQVEEIEKKVA